MNAALGHSQAIFLEITESDRKPVEKLNDFVISRFNLCKDYPEISRFVRDVLTGSIRKDVSINIQKMLNKQKILFEKILIQGREQGLFRSDMDIDMFILSLMGSLNMLIMRYLKGWEDELTQEKARRLVDNIIKGIGI